jgi:DNA-binding MarR family transcriptional regulator
MLAISAARPTPPQVRIVTPHTSGSESTSARRNRGRGSDRGTASRGSGIDRAELATRLRLELARLNRQLRGADMAGLTPSGLSALAMIEARGPLRLGELARAESLTPPTVTKIVAALEAKGLVWRRTDDDDRRSALVELTAAGTNALVRIRSARDQLLAKRVDLLTEVQCNALRDALDVVAMLTRVES